MSLSREDISRIIELRSIHWFECLKNGILTLDELKLILSELEDEEEYEECASIMKGINQYVEYREINK